MVDGRVRVYSQGRDILTIEPDQTVGELAVLDPEPRSASVSALENTFLLRLAKAAFDEVVADRPEIAAGVIRSLCQRIRQEGQLLAAQGGN